MFIHRVVRSDARRKISEELLEIVRYYRTSGMELYGMEDETGETLLVIEN